VLCKLDLDQKMAERLCGTTFLSLASRRKADSIGLVCKLLDSWWSSLQNISPVIVFVTHAYSCHVTDDCLLLQWLIRYNSLDLFINSFLGMIPSIWATISLILRERERCYWGMVCRLLSTSATLLLTINYCTTCIHYAAIICMCVHCIWYCKNNQF